jgi:hypothetical protein
VTPAASSAAFWFRASVSFDTYILSADLLVITYAPGGNALMLLMAGAEEEEELVASFRVADTFSPATFLFLLAKVNFFLGLSFALNSAISLFNASITYNLNAMQGLLEVASSAKTL